MSSVEKNETSLSINSCQVVGKYHAGAICLRRYKCAMLHLNFDQMGLVHERTMHFPKNSVTFCILGHKNIEKKMTQNSCFPDFL